jgi:hypothetical protein
MTGWHHPSPDLFHTPKVRNNISAAVCFEIFTTKWMMATFCLRLESHRKPECQTIIPPIQVRAKNLGYFDHSELGGAEQRGDNCRLALTKL